MPPKEDTNDETETEAQAEAGVLTPEPINEIEDDTPKGFHVVRTSDGLSLGVYETAEDAEDFANQHPRAGGVEVSIVEAK